MTRRSFHRGAEAERRQALITATLDCIAESGLQGATVRQIASRAGVTGGLIRHYFAGKDEMLQAAYRETMAAMIEAAETAAEMAGDDPRARLHDFIVANLSPPVTDARMLSLWAAFIGHIRTDPVFGEIQRENYLASIDTLERLVLAFLNQCSRTVAPKQARDFAVAISGLIDGLWLEASLADDLFEEGALPALALSAVEAILGGVSLSKT